jgi:hypothetical protein
LVWAASLSGLLTNAADLPTVTEHRRSSCDDNDNCDNNDRRTAQAMKTTGHEQNAVYMPPELLAEAREAASEEHRPADELVSDAVRRYLEQRKEHPATPRTNLAQLLMNSPFAGANLDLERRKDYTRPIEL